MSARIRIYSIRIETGHIRLVGYEVATMQRDCVYWVKLCMVDLLKIDCECQWANYNFFGLFCQVRVLVQYMLDSGCTLRRNSMSWAQSIAPMDRFTADEHRQFVRATRMNVERSIRMHTSWRMPEGAAASVFGWLAADRFTSSCAKTTRCLESERCLWGFDLPTLPDVVRCGHIRRPHIRRNQWSWSDRKTWRWCGWSESAKWRLRH